MVSRTCCPHCQGPNAEGVARCAHCGLLVKRRRPRDEGSPVVCPACGSPSEFACLAGIQVDLCPRCKGVWFDDRELAELPANLSNVDLAKAAAEFLLSLPPAARRRKRPAYLVCPVCAGHLAPRNFREVSGILTDRCDGCGTWVDHVNVLKILRLIASQQLDDVDRRAAWQRQERERNQAALREPRRQSISGFVFKELNQEVRPVRPRRIQNALADGATVLLAALGFLPDED
jgi:Zn-finger nucleic acid-binding protein